MAEDEEVKLPVTVHDRASKSLERIGEAAEKLGHHFDHSLHKIMEVGTALAGVAGAFGFERMVESGKESLEQLNKMSKLTGTSAQNVGALRDVFEASGLGAEQLAMTVTQLGKKTLMLQEGGKQLVAESKRWGVELKKGPVAALVTMSDAVKKHKIGEAEVQKLTRATGENLGAMMELLGEGPEELKAAIEAAQKANKHLSAEGLESFVKFHKASQKIHQAWRALSERVVIALAPVMTKLADKLSSAMGSIGDHAEKFANFLVKGMDFAVRHAKTLSRIMIANALLMKTQGFGVMGAAQRFLPKVWGIGSGLGGQLGEKAGMLAARGAGALGLAARIPKWAGAGTVGSMGGAAGGIFSIVSTLLKLAGGATGIGLIVAGVIAIVQNFDKIRTYFGPAIERIWNALKGIAGKIAEAFSEDSAIGKFARFMGNFWGTVLDKWLGALGKALELIGSFIDFVDVGITALVKGESMDKVRSDRSIKRSQERMQKIQDAGFGDYLGGGKKQSDLIKLANAHGKVTDKQRMFFEQYAKSYEKAGFDTKGAAFSKLKERYGAKEAPAGPQINQDFRGSRFEITQAFAEGFDPDRVATAFANEMGSLGERRLQSGLSPLFGIR